MCVLQTFIGAMAITFYTSPINPPKFQNPLRSSTPSQAVARQRPRLACHEVGTSLQRGPGFVACRGSPLSTPILKWGFPKFRGTILRDLYNQDYSILGSTLSPLILGNYQICLYSPHLHPLTLVKGPLSFLESPRCWTKSVPADWQNDGNQMKEQNQNTNHVCRGKSFSRFSSVFFARNPSRVPNYRRRFP